MMMMMMTIGGQTAIYGASDQRRANSHYGGNTHRRSNTKKWSNTEKRLSTDLHPADG